MMRACVGTRTPLSAHRFAAVVLDEPLERIRDEPGAVVRLMAVVIAAEGRFAEIEYRIETMPQQDAWRGELATTRRRHGEVAPGSGC